MKQQVLEAEIAALKEEVNKFRLDAFLKGAAIIVMQDTIDRQRAHIAALTEGSEEVWR